MADTISFAQRNSLTVVLPIVAMVVYNYMLTRKEPMWTLQPMNIVLPMLFMTALSPGLILSLPPGDGSKILFSGRGATNTQLLVHALAMLLGLKFVRDSFPQFYSFSL